MISWAERAKVAIGQKGQYRTAKTDESLETGVSSVSSVGFGATFTSPERLSSVLAVPPTTVLQKRNLSVDVMQDPDRWCWPHSSALNSAEIDLVLARLDRFTEKGLLGSDGAALADKLVIRDRESDDRRVCLECIELTGHGVHSWRCSNWQAAGIAHQAWDAQLASDLVVLPQRCNGFAGLDRSNTNEESGVVPKIRKK